MSLSVSAALLVAILAVHAARGFYLPGAEPKEYKDGEQVQILVNSLRSLTTAVPYSYYYLPFCKPATLQHRGESLGELLWGDDIQNSLYFANMGRNEKCVKIGCADNSDDALFAQVDQMEKFINDGYRGHMSIDNLPGFNNGSAVLNGRCAGKIPTDQQYPFQRGYAIGVHKNCIGRTLVNNHLDFQISFHNTSTGARVVGFTINPFSVKHAPDGNDCGPTFDPDSQFNNPLTTDDLRAKTKPFWSYSVTWIEEPNINWGSRWDSYFRTSAADSNQRVHWVYIINSLLITMCLCTIATMILLRTLHKDFNRYNSEDPDETQEEVGWKLVHADVFRPPVRSSALCIVIGTGVQILLMAVTALFFAMLGFLSPANRGGLLTTLLLLFVLMSFAAGYTCGRLLKFFDAQQWKTVFACAFLFPGMSFSCFFFTDLINWHLNASDSVPLMTVLTLIGLWFGISVPLVILGASFAFRQAVLTVPLRVGKLAREIPTQRWYLAPPFTYIVPPLIPLGAAFLELKFILGSLWQGMVYYVFGFLALVAVVWGVTVALTTIIVIYYQLCFEDYRWWWRSMIIPGGLGVHFFLYTIYFYFTSLNLTGAVGTFNYLLYMALLSLAYGLAAGTIGFFTSYFFIRKIYSSIKID